MTFKEILNKLSKRGAKLDQEELDFFLKQIKKDFSTLKVEEILENIAVKKKGNIKPLRDNLWKILDNIDFTVSIEEMRIQGLIIIVSSFDLDLKETENKKLKDRLKDKGKFKRAGHLTDQMLKYNYPKDKQPDLFSGLKETTLDKIESRGIKHSEIVEGIKLSPSETKIIDCLCKLLHNNSQIYDKENSNYYTGNKEAQIVKYGEETRDIAPRLGFTLYEFTQGYKGDPNISGKDVKNVHNILEELSKKDFLIKYREEIKHKDGKKTVNEVEMFDRIIKLPTHRQIKYDKGVETSKREETLIKLHPIFRRQIDSKFILYPNDINKRTIIAYGSPNVSEITYRLRDYLMRELSSKHYQPEFFQDKLYYFLAEKWMNESRKKKVKEYTDKALETMIDIGLLESYKIEPAKTTGEPKVVFKLNKDFE